MDSGNASRYPLVTCAAECYKTYHSLIRPGAPLEAILHLEDVMKKPIAFDTTKSPLLTWMEKLPRSNDEHFDWWDEFTIPVNRGHKRQAERGLARSKAGLAGSRLDERMR